MGIEIIKCKNPKCGKILVKHPGQKRLNPNRRYCDVGCQTRHISYLKFIRLRDDPAEKKKKSDFIKVWYQNNKKRQKANVMRNYKENMGAWAERRYVGNHRKEFLELINQKCICGESVKVIHHKTYAFNRNWKNPGITGIDPFNLKEYAAFLEGFCSKKCHMHHHRILNDKEDFLSLESVYDILNRKYPLINQLTKEGE